MRTTLIYSKTKSRHWIKTLLLLSLAVMGGQALVAQTWRSCLVTEKKPVSIDIQQGEQAWLTLDTYVTDTVVYSKGLPTDLVFLFDVSTTMYYRGEQSVTSVYGPFSYNNCVVTDDDYLDLFYVNGYYVGTSTPMYQVYREFAAPYYRLYCYHEGAKSYLSGNRLTTTPPTNVTDPDADIFTGTLYKSATRLSAAQAAACDIIKQMEGKGHRVSLVRFSGNYEGDESSIVEGNHFGKTEVLKNFVDVDSQGLATLIDAVHSILPGNQSYDDYGLKKAELLLKQNYNGTDPSMRKKMVICFTDGVVTTGHDGPAISIARTLKKDLNATVFTYAPLYKEPTTDNNQKKFMKYVSSGYPDAMSLTQPGDPVEDDTKYWQFVSQSGGFEAIMKAINDSEVGYVTFKLGPDAVVQDVISDDFHLPDGFTVDDIQLFTADVRYFLPNNPHYNEFADPEPLNDPAVRVSVNGKTIQVTGFDFAAHYLHTDENYEDKGKKLIIKIPIVNNDGIYGDHLYTNVESESGVRLKADNGFVQYYPKSFLNIKKTTWVQAVTKAPDGWGQDADGYYIIDSPDDLAWFISFVNGHNGQDAHPDANARLTADVDMSAYNWVPIGSGNDAWYPEPAGNLAPKDHAFSGTFDGGFHSIKGLWNQNSVITQSGLFSHVDGGTVKNTIVADCDFHAGFEGSPYIENSRNAYYGIIADTLSNGAIVCNSEAAGLLSVGYDPWLLAQDLEGNGDNTYEEYYQFSILTKVNLGGVVGLAQSGTEIHSCISVAAIIGEFMGGVVNTLDGQEKKDDDGYSFDPPQYENGAVMRNCYSYPVFRYATGFDYVSHNTGGKGLYSYSRTLGGLVTCSTGGQIENCYVRERDSVDGFWGIRAMYRKTYKLDNPHVLEPYLKGIFVADNSNGQVQDCYMPAEWTDMTVDSLVGKNQIIELPLGTGLYTITETPYMYRHADNDASLLDPADTHNPYVNSVGDLPWLHFQDALNAWVDDHQNEAPNGLPYARWSRTCASPVNDDYPVLLMPGANAVASDGDVLYYGDVRDLLDKELTTPDLTDDVVFMYDDGPITKNNQRSPKAFYVGEGVCIRHPRRMNNGPDNTYVGVTFDNSASDWDWHMFSSSLTFAFLGIDYRGDNTEYPFSYTNPGTQYNFYDESVIDGFFPSKTYRTGDDYYEHWDFYTYDEPSYHFINFKRNSNSHWHQDGDHEKIKYNNESKLIQAQGYMMAIDQPTFMQAYGQLSFQGNNFILSRKAKHNPGYNLVGNPYQAIFDFNLFAADQRNSRVLGSNISYTTYDADQGGYVSYVSPSGTSGVGDGVSTGAMVASRYISPLQGFFLYAPEYNALGEPWGETPENCRLYFEPDFCKLRAEVDNTYQGFRGGEEPAQPTFPLVNLIATDDNGKNDILVVEFDRPENGGARKMIPVRSGKGSLYARHQDENMSIAFVEEGITEIPVRFETMEDAVFTMTSQPANGPFRYLHLIDNITGIDHDLLADSTFTFEAKASDYKSRFKLVMALEAVEEAEDDVIADQFAYFDGGTWIVEAKGDMEVYDITGRLMLSKHLANAQNSIDLSGLAVGVYLMRVSNGSDVKMQKIVLE